MASPPSPDLTPSGALLMLAASFFGPAVAPYVSTYGLILIGWCTGALIGIYMRPADGLRLPVLAFSFISLMLVMGFTVPASQILAPYVQTVFPWLGPVAPASLFFAVSVVIPAVGTRWIEIGKWLASKWPKKSGT